MRRLKTTINCRFPFEKKTVANQKPDYGACLDNMILFANHREETGVLIFKNMFLVSIHVLEG